MNDRYTPVDRETYGDIPFSHYFWDRKRLDALLIPLAGYRWRKAPCLTKEDRQDFTAEYKRRVTYYSWLGCTPWGARWQVFFGKGE